MRRWKVRGLVATTLLIGAVWLVGPGGFASVGPADAGESSPGGRLDILYSSPILVRAGEAVRMPVDVVCAIRAGHPCSFTTTLGTREGSSGWNRTSIDAAAPVLFDLAAPAGRAIAGRTSASVDFYLEASDRSGRQTRLPASGSHALRFHVVRELPVVRVPAIPFGDVRVGEPVLVLPWGTGPMRAGLAHGAEALALGPSGFAVGSNGHIHVLDDLQHRVGVFSEGVLVRQTAIDATGRSSIAVSGDGTAFVLDASRGLVGVRTIETNGRVNPEVAVGRGVPAQIRLVGDAAHARVLPLDAWVGLPDATGVGPDLSVGRPLGAGRELLAVAREGYVRLAMLEGGEALGAVEMRSDHAFGDLALAEPDGSGGYLVVVRVWREGPDPADQYQFVHVAGGRVASTFAIESSPFAAIPPASRFRLGPDGALYHMTTSPDGMRIVRYELGEADR